MGIKALEKSDILETNKEKLEVRRKPSLPIPDWNDETKKANISRTVYCKGFEKEKTTLDDLIKFFNKFPGVIHVVRRTYPKGDERFFKGSTFVTFKDKDHAQKFLDVDEVKNPQDEVLLRKWQQEYFDEKDAESKEKSKVKDDELEFKVLEGQEETDFLEKCKSDIAQQKDKARRGHKRQGGGGRGEKFNNKRQRR